MNKKLNKEQAQWLIDRFSTGFGRDNDTFYGIKPSEVRDDAIKIINECTEKEFPEVEMKSGWKDEIVRISIKNLSDYKEYIEIDSTGSSCFFTSSQFKQFVKNCQNIVEWLDEQENN